MTQPLIGAEGWDGRKKPSDIVHPSMSTLPKVLHSGALESWGFTQTAKNTVANLGRLAAMSVEEAEKWVTDARWQRPDGLMRAADRGTYLHTVLEHWMEGATPPDPPAEHEAYLRPFINQLYSWMVEYQPKMVLSEAAVFSTVTHTAGRGDLWVTFPNHTGDQVWLLDAKTKEDRTARGHETKPYGDSEAIQLAGYRYATHRMTFPPRVKGESWQDRKQYGGRAYLLNEAEVAASQPMSEIVGDPAELRTAVLLLTPERALIYEIDTGPEVFEAFKAVRAAWTWSYETSNNVVSAPWPREAA